MRCHYMSDLHLESQDFAWTMPRGDVLIVAGDLCHASCLEPGRTDLYATRQRERVLRFVDSALAGFTQVLLVAGNHDHYDGIFEDTIASLRRCLPGITVLDDECVEIGGVRFFGATLWSDFEGRSDASLEKARRGVGEYFFVRTRARDAEPSGKPAKFQPRDALAAHDRSLEALRRCVAGPTGKMSTVVISHHAPSRKGLNPLHGANGLDGAYASDLDTLIKSLSGVPVWVHGHTHIKRTYRIGATLVRTNCRGFDNRDPTARMFSPDMWFDL